MNDCGAEKVHTQLHEALSARDPETEGLIPVSIGSAPKVLSYDRNSLNRLLKLIRNRKRAYRKAMLRRYFKVRLRKATRILRRIKNAVGF